MAIVNQNLHFLLVPLMYKSHLIPFTDLAKLLARHGQRVTVVMTQPNAALFNSSLVDLKINFLYLSVSSKDDGSENMDHSSQDPLKIFLQEVNMLEGPLEEWLQQVKDLESFPSCIISDFCLPWTTELARKFQIPRVVLQTVSCFTLLCGHNLTRYKVVNTVESDFDPFLIPDVPDRIEFTKAQLPPHQRNTSDDLKNLGAKFNEAAISATAILLNSFEEIESHYLKGYQEVLTNKLWCIGPLLLCNKAPNIQEHACLNWLDSKNPSSVIFVCFGSVSHMSLPQIIELGLGLESSNSPFIWVVKEEYYYNPEVQNWFNKQRFEERVQERGLIIRGWAPQVQILSHPSVGGFITHCGWNSTLEGVSAGLPMITWPMFAEQFYNEKLIVQILEIGVKVGVEAAMDMDAEVLVKSEDVKKAIEQLVDGGGEERRERAKKLGEMAKRAVEEGGSSYLNVKMLIQHINQQLIPGKILPASY